MRQRLNVRFWVKRMETEWTNNILYIDKINRINSENGRIRWWWYRYERNICTTEQKRTLKVFDTCAYRADEQILPYPLSISTEICFLFRFVSHFFDSVQIWCFSIYFFGNHYCLSYSLVSIFACSLLLLILFSPFSYLCWKIKHVFAIRHHHRHRRRVISLFFFILRPKWWHKIRWTNGWKIYRQILMKVHIHRSFW